MKNIYLAQPTNMLSGTVYLPYTVGTIAAYAWQFPEIKKEYELKELVFLKEPIDKAVEKLDNPYLVGFSSYLWNVEYNLDFACEIKKKWPECKILFGGPQIPDDTEYLESYDFIDVLMHAEGEMPFYKLLLAYLNGGDLSDVPSISYRENGTVLRNQKEIPCNLNNFPSPYTTGLFDSIVNNPEYSGVQFDAVLETNRGCPYSCAYCYWSGNDDPFRPFPIERVKGDLEWFAKNKIAFCICADANFGIINRDEEIVDYLISLKKEFGYPQKFETIAAKEKDDFIFKINQKMHAAGLNKGVSVACQSLSPTVLENVGRKNMPANRLSQSLARYRNAGISTYTDIMLGLPGETFESFCRGVFEVIEAGQHDSVNINRCELLPNSLMYSKEYVEKYKIKTIRSSLCQNHSKASNGATPGSRSDLIVETDTMSRDDWKESCRIACFVQSFHLMGLIRFVSVYLRKAKDVSYHDFYMHLYRKINSEGKVSKRTFSPVMENFSDFLEGKCNLCFSDERFGDIYWPHEEGLFLCTVYQLDEFFDEIKAYIAHYFDDEELFEDLLSYQKNIICAFGSEVKELEFKYDWLDYFSDIISMEKLVPEKKSILLRFEPSYENDWFEYAKKIVWFGKRDNRSIVKPVLLK
ncbi:MAG: radical SAM protein [Clostridia bacterium]|nr:radical SAM protein [Clostridia bacterium]